MSPLRDGNAKLGAIEALAPTSDDTAIVPVMMAARIQLDTLDDDCMAVDLS
jgi:hypothetical protein